MISPERSIRPIDVRHFINKPVLIKLENHEIRGLLTSITNGQHGGLGNLFVNTKNGPTIVRGSVVHAVILLRNER